MLTATSIPETMRAVQGKDYGDIDDQLTVEEGVRVPRLSDKPEKYRKDFMVVKTMAVALAPGDCRVLSGKTRELQGPPSFPYVPGGDCSGIVVEIAEGGPFQVGDQVAVRFMEVPRGALGEYALVSAITAEKIPENLTEDEAAALAGAAPASVLSEHIQKGERVLVIGAGGGMGSHVCQLIKTVRGAAYVVGVSEDPERLLRSPVSCDDAINYHSQDPFVMEKFQNEPFDVIIDLAGGGYERLENSNGPLIVKPGSQGGRFITTVPPIGPIFEAHSIWGILNIFLFPVLWKAFTSRAFHGSKLPAYTFGMSLPATRDHVTQTMQYAEQGKLKAQIDSKGPFSFTTEGVRAAFHLQESRHPKGKVVVHIWDGK